MDCNREWRNSWYYFPVAYYIETIWKWVKVVIRWDIPEILKYKELNKIYHGILSVEDLIANFNVDDESLSIFLGYLNDIYAGNPYSYSSELSRKSWECLEI